MKVAPALRDNEVTVSEGTPHDLTEQQSVDDIVPVFELLWQWELERRDDGPHE